MIARAVYRLAFVTARAILDSGRKQSPGSAAACATEGKQDPAVGRCGPQRAAAAARRKPSRRQEEKP